MAKSRREFLEQYSDPEYQIPDNWTSGSLTIVEAKRIARSGLVARYAADVPRRLGGDASSPELSADKKLSKRIAYVYLSLWTRFVNSPHAPLPPEECPPDLIPPRNWKAMYVRAAAEDEFKSAGATVIWENWWRELRPMLMARRMVLASFALDRGESNWGYRLVVGLTDELEWIEEKFAAYDRAVNRRAAA